MAESAEQTQTRVLTFGALLLGVATLYVARDLIIPLALALLFSFILAPFATRLQRLGMGRVTSVVTVVSVTVLGALCAGWIIGQQVFELTQQFPRYRQNIVAKIDSVHHSLSPAVVKANSVLTELTNHLHPSKEVAGKSPSDSPKPPEEYATPGNEIEPQAVPVRVVSTPVSVPSMLGGYLGPVLAPLESIFVVAILVIFMLIQREDSRNRIIRLVGATQLRITTQAINDASSRVSRYLVMQLLINTIYGIAVTIGLMLIGLPNSILWGLLATALRFMPYIGPVIGGALPLLLSIAVFEGWSRPLIVFGWFVVLELITANVLEPWLYHSSTGVSPLGVILSAVFWTWLWGGVGLVLAMPLTVCLTVLGRYVPQFRFLHILLGDEPPLIPGAIFYQRLLSYDQDEAADQVKEFLKTRPLMALYDEVLLPALRLAEEDRRSGHLEAARLKFMRQTIRETVDDLETNVNPPLAANAKHPEILCICARPEGDDLAAQMLTQLLRNSGCRTETWQPDSLNASAQATETLERADVIWISAMPPGAEAAARELVKQLKARGRTKVFVGLWTGPQSPRSRDQLLRAGATTVLFTMTDALEETLDAFKPSTENAIVATPATAEVAKASDVSVAATISH